jgi:Ala-tRNA(Pro) deacylase
MPVQKLKDFLDSQKVKYVVISHSTAYTAQEIAASAHIPGQQLAKTVVVRLDSQLAMSVLPASYKVDLAALKEATGAQQVELAGEPEFRSQFPECELGAMPPFGNLYDLPVYVDESLTRDEIIAFNAGSHTELIKLSYKDFEALVKPNVLKFATLQAGAATPAK